MTTTHTYTRTHTVVAESGPFRVVLFGELRPEDEEGPAQLQSNRGSRTHDMVAWGPLEVMLDLFARAAAKRFS